MKRIVALLLLMILLAGCGRTASDATIPSGGKEDSLPTSFTGLGGKMPEITVNTADGQTLKLTELLKEKELVVLNFWFADCIWCQREFPALEAAYQSRREDVEVLALNPADGAETVKAFQEQYGLRIPMAACPRSWATESGVSSYPTSIFVDREGVVCLIHVGAITASDDWGQLFDAFLGQDYQQKIYYSAKDILG